MSISVLIVSYRTPELTLAAVRSALAIPVVGEVIVADNASGDDTIRRLHAIDDPRLHVIQNRTNVGFGSGHNIASRVSSGDILVLLNSDAALSEQGLRDLVEPVANDDGQSLAGPRLLMPDGQVQRSAGLLPAPTDLALRAVGIAGAARWLSRAPIIGAMMQRSRLVDEYNSAVSATEIVDTDMVSGACFAIGRAAFSQLGGFDERFFMYFEDADLCKRAASAGMAIRYVPSAVVTHVVGASSEGDYHFSPMHARSMRQYLEKWWGRPGATLAILLLWVRLVGHALVLHRGTGKAFAALRAALRP